MDEDQVEKIKNGRLLEVIRMRPALWLGKRSLSALWHFLAGWGTALLMYDIKAARQLPDDFHDWVAYRLHFRESTAGYTAMILKRVPDESAALDRFFELLDEHHHRQACVIARLLGHKKTYYREVVQDGVRSSVTVPYPQNLSFVSYTDDRGFFVVYDQEESVPPIGSRFYASLSSFEFGITAETPGLQILHRDVFNRWLLEDEQYLTELRARRASAEADKGG